MANMTDFAGFNFNPEELKALREVIGEEVFNMKALTDNHVIEQGIDYKQQIVFAGRMGMFTKKLKTGADACDVNEADAIQFTEKVWDPEKFEGRLVHCSATVDAQNKLINQFTQLNPDFFNKIDASGEGAELARFLLAAATGALQEEIPWKAWFSDKDADLVANGGVFTDGDVLDFVNVIDGFWKQIEEEIGAGDKNYVEIEKNSEATAEGQELADNEGLDILRKMWKGADKRLKRMNDKQLLVTDTIYDNLLSTYEDRQANGGILTRLENGGGLSFRGVEVKSMAEEWDVFIDAHMTDENGVAHQPHRALLTTKSNIPVGTTSTNDLTKLDAFYDKKSKTNNIDAIYNLDAKFLESYLAVAAY